jgi:hypothetical protein
MFSLISILFIKLPSFNYNILIIMKNEQLRHQQFPYEYEKWIHKVNKSNDKTTRKESLKKHRKNCFGEEEKFNNIVGKLEKLNRMINSKSMIESLNSISFSQELGSPLKERNFILTPQIVLETKCHKNSSLESTFQNSKSHSPGRRQINMNFERIKTESDDFTLSSEKGKYLTYDLREADCEDKETILRNTLCGNFNHKSSNTQQPEGKTEVPFLKGSQVSCQISEENLKEITELIQEYDQINEIYETDECQIANMVNFSQRYKEKWGREEKTGSYQKNFKTLKVDKFVKDKKTSSSKPSIKKAMEVIQQNRNKSIKILFGDKEIINPKKLKNIIFKKARESKLFHIECTSHKRELEISRSMRKCIQQKPLMENKFPEKNPFSSSNKLEKTESTFQTHETIEEKQHFPHIEIEFKRKNINDTVIKTQSPLLQFLSTQGYEIVFLEKRKSLEGCYENQGNLQKEFAKHKRSVSDVKCMQEKAKEINQELKKNRSVSTLIKNPILPSNSLRKNRGTQSIENLRLHFYQKAGKTPNPSQHNPSFGLFLSKPKSSRRCSVKNERESALQDEVLNDYTDSYNSAHKNIVNKQSNAFQKKKYSLDLEKRKGTDVLKFETPSLGLFLQKEPVMNKISSVEVEVRKKNEPKSEINLKKQEDYDEIKKGYEAILQRAESSQIFTDFKSACTKPVHPLNNSFISKVLHSKRSTKSPHCHHGRLKEAYPCKKSMSTLPSPSHTKEGIVLDLYTMEDCSPLHDPPLRNHYSTSEALPNTNNKRRFNTPLRKDNIPLTQILNTKINTLKLTNPSQHSKHLNILNNRDSTNSNTHTHSSQSTDQHQHQHHYHSYSKYKYKYKSKSTNTSTITNTTKHPTLLLNPRFYANPKSKIHSKAQTVHHSPTAASNIHNKPLSINNVISSSHSSLSAANNPNHHTISPIRFSYNYNKSLTSTSNPLKATSSVLPVPHTADTNNSLPFSYIYLSNFSHRKGFSESLSGRKSHDKSKRFLGKLNCPFHYPAKNVFEAVNANPFVEAKQDVGCKPNQVNGNYLKMKKKQKLSEKKDKGDKDRKWRVSCKKRASFDSEEERKDNKMSERLFTNCEVLGSEGELYNFKEKRERYKNKPLIIPKIIPLKKN